MKQQLLFREKKSRTEHGGDYSIAVRRESRPLSLRRPHHVTMRSRHATGPRSLARNRELVRKVMNRSARMFEIRIYRSAFCGNHIHLVIFGKTRAGLQNFFRVFAGHLAQEILRLYPLTECEDLYHGVKMKKNQRRFWDLLTYSRILSWGREFKTVSRYVTKNILETLHLMAYKRTSRSFERKIPRILPGDPREKLRATPGP